MQHSFSLSLSFIEKCTCECLGLVLLDLGSQVVADVAHVGDPVLDDDGDVLVHRERDLLGVALVKKLR